MKIQDLNTEQKEQFCNACAVVIFYEETESAYSNAMDFLDIAVPDGFDYTDDYSGELYQKVQEVYIDTMYIRLLFDATYNEDNFAEWYSWNKGFVFAIDQLTNCNDTFKTYDDFQVFCETITDA
jgi:hypothetical protein